MQAPEAAASPHSPLLLALTLAALALLPSLEGAARLAPPAAAHQLHLRGGSAPTAQACAECAARAAARAFLLQGGGAPSPYSAVSCTAGSQAFALPWHVFTHNYREPSWPGYRMCLLRNACIIGGVPTLYLDAAAEARTPPALRLEALVGAGGSLYRGPYEASVGTPLAPRLVHGPRPPHLRTAPPGRLYLATALNNAQNYAHLLLDTVLPAYSAADFYGLGVEDVQHVGLTTCDNFQNSGWVSKGSGASFASACWGNMDKWYAPLMPHPFLDGSGSSSSSSGDACYGAVLLGSDAVFSSAMFGAHMDRARGARALRARALAFAQGAGQPPPPRHPSPLGVLVLQQFQPVNAPSAFPDLCELVGRAVRGSSSSSSGAASVACSTPGAQGLAEQVTAVASAGVVVCEHGSTCYAGLFAAQGASMLVLVPGNATVAKEGHVLLFLPDISVYFLGEVEARGGGGEGAGLAGAMELALRRAGERMPRAGGGGGQEGAGAAAG